MGFNKRHIRKETMCTIYKNEGIEGLKRYFSADALIVEMGIDTNGIIEMLTEDNDKDLKTYIESLGTTHN